MERRKPELDLARYLLTQCIVGGITGLVWGIVMLATNAAGLGGLVSGSSQPAMNAALFLTEAALIFMPVAVAVSIASLAAKDDR
jgi:hypothetical protein